MKWQKYIYIRAHETRDVAAAQSPWKGAGSLSGAEEQTARAISAYAQYAFLLFFAKAVGAPRMERAGNTASQR